MAERDDTCTKCRTNPGVWECAVCGEVPLCEACVKTYQDNGWQGHGCFCVEPKHELALIEDQPEDDEAGWDVATRCAVEAIADENAEVQRMLGMLAATLNNVQEFLVGHDSAEWSRRIRMVADQLLLVRGQLGDIEVHCSRDIPLPPGSTLFAAVVAVRNSWRKTLPDNRQGMESLLQSHDDARKLLAGLIDTLQQAMSRI